MSTPTTPNHETADPGSPEALREEIERTREELAETVDALHAKLDVKAQAQARLARAKDRATTDSGKPRPEVVAGGVGSVLLVTGLLWWRRG